MRKNKRTHATGAERRLLDEASPLPLYHRLYLLLREQIMTGMYPPGHLLPAEADLMTLFGVSRVTVQRALNTLATEGLLTRSRGRGTTVSDNSATSRVESPISASINGLLTSLSTVGQGTTVRVISVEYQPAAPYIAEQLQITPGTVVQHAERVRMLRAKPYSHSISYVPKEIGKTFTRKDLEAHPLIDLLHRTGVKIDRVEQAITCTLADERSADLLETKVGSPVLKLRRIFVSDEDRPVNYAEILYPPERFEYRMTWRRDAANQMLLDDSAASLPV